MIYKKDFIILFLIIFGFLFIEISNIFYTNLYIKSFISTLGVIIIFKTGELYETYNREKD